MNPGLPKQICIIGAGYVGMSYAVLISSFADIKIWDIDSKKRDLINAKKLPIQDLDSESILSEKENWNIVASKNLNEALNKSQLVLICISTDFNESKNSFDVNEMNNLIDQVRKYSPNVQIVIKSTVPIGYSAKITQETGLNILFSPEFLREGMAIRDNQFPSRIIIGKTNQNQACDPYLSVAQEIAKNSPEIFEMSASEAESVKLFSNSYLAMRIAFFNEVDGFALENNLSIKDIIEGMSADNRIGNYYNNPSFGFGGYCLPKDSRQALVSMNDLPNELIQSINISNSKRKEFISKYLLHMDKDLYGFYRINMKENSDNMRESASIEIIKILLSAGKQVIIYEPLLNNTNDFDNFELVKNLDEFKERSDIIIANRVTEEILDCKEKLFSRDLSYDTKIRPKNI